LNFFANYTIRTGNYAGALLKLDKIIERYPFHIVALACRAHCYHQMGKHEDGSKDRTKIRALIKQNHDSQKLFNRYGNQLQALLKEYDLING